MSIARFVAIVSFAILTIPAHSDESGVIDETASACGDLLSSMYRAKEHGWAPLENFRLLESQCESTQFYYQHRAQLESFVGNHRKALTYWDKNFSRRSEDQETLAGQGRTTPAIEAENRQAVQLQGFTPTTGEICFGIDRSRPSIIPMR